MIVFVGLLYSEERRKAIKKDVKTGLESAANTYQWSVLRGLQEATDEPIQILNSVPMGVYPKYSKILFEKSSVEAGDIPIDNIGYCNLPVIKQSQRKNGLYKRLKKILQTSQELVTVVLYSIYNPYLKALKRLKKKFPSFKYVIIVTDLPLQYGVESRNPLRRYLDRKLGKASLAMSAYADGYVLLTKQMAEVVPVGDKPVAIVEGIAKLQQGLTDSDETGAPIILYTGNMGRKFGIEVLLEAFRKLPANSARLWFAGGGDCVADVEEASKTNANVQYLGYCTKEEVFALQNKASILVNPRPATEEYTKYSFPSKTMEYLSMGKPVAMNKLPGLPAEYEPHVFLFAEETAEGMAKTFTDILTMDKTAMKAHTDQQLAFIAEEKSEKKQAEKILALIKEL